MGWQRRHPSCLPAPFGLPSAPPAPPLTPYLPTAPHLLLVPHKLHAVRHVTQQHKVLHHLDPRQQHGAVVEGCEARKAGQSGGGGEGI